jgi:hypothetical protein
MRWEVWARHTSRECSTPTKLAGVLNTDKIGGNVYYLKIGVEKARGLLDSLKAMVVLVLVVRWTAFAFMC